jgi:hypothetical protein
MDGGMTLMDSLHIERNTVMILSGVHLYRLYRSVVLTKTYKLHARMLLFTENHHETNK